MSRGLVLGMRCTSVSLRNKWTTLLGKLLRRISTSVHFTLHRWPSDAALGPAESAEKARDIASKAHVITLHVRPHKLVFTAICSDLLCQACPPVRGLPFCETRAAVQQSKVSHLTATLQPQKVEGSVAGRPAAGGDLDAVADAAAAGQPVPGGALRAQVHGRAAAGGAAHHLEHPRQGQPRQLQAMLLCCLQCSFVECTAPLLGGVAHRSAYVAVHGCSILPAKFRCKNRCLPCAHTECCLQEQMSSG